MVSSLWPPVVLGGAELHAAALAARLRAAGHEVAVLTAGVDGDDVVASVRPWGHRQSEYAGQSRVRKLAFHAGDLLRPDVGRVVDRALERFRPDVVHSHAVQGMSVTGLTRVTRRGVAHVHTLHDYWLLCQRNTLVTAAGRPCLTRCRSCRAVSAARNAQLARRPPDVVLAVSEAVARAHTDAIAWTRDRTRVLYNPVERAADAHRPPTAGAPTFGFLGQVSAVKGIRTLVRAFRDAAIPQARLVVAGRGTDVDAVTGVPGVDHRGWVDAAGRDALYREVDAVVVPSEWQDPAPLVVNEARGRGITVIGARAGGIPELVAPASAPLLFTAGDAAELTERLCTFAAEPARFGAPPEAAPLDWDAHLAGVLAAYADARSATGSHDDGVTGHPAVGSPAPSGDPGAPEGGR
jgi:glycosyltransferase involved in cell wall biosynthesis